jgi:uncharacterized protein (DUF1330 family)
MAAYLISDITVRDGTAFEIYRTGAADAIHTHGGRYLARLGEVQVLEGSWNPNMIVIVEFPNCEQAGAWYRSPEYAFALEVRDIALTPYRPPRITSPRINGEFLLELSEALVYLPFNRE